MREVIENVFVGNQDDYENIVCREGDWSIIQACKEPYHRRALGYAGKGAPKDNPEYLFAYRDNRLILNMVDVADYRYISKELIDEAVSFFGKAYSIGKKIFIHCNQGMSRSPSIAMLCLAIYTDIFDGLDFEKSENKFKKLYPEYMPARGIHDFMFLHWDEYVRSK